MSWLTRRLFGISETNLARPGFACGDEALREQLEAAGRSIVAGYNMALEDPGDVGRRLVEEIDVAHQGFAFEGAGLALTLLDTVLPLLTTQSRLQRFLDGPAVPHAYIVHIGSGWILGHLPLSPQRLLRRLDPFFGWLAIDGYGFHEAFFRPRRTVRDHFVPRRLRGYARRVFDQGVGRGLWFFEAADPERIRTMIDAFPVPRQQDLWSGIGLASAYAGGLTRNGLETLAALSGPCLPALAQGAAFGAEARHQARNPAPHTELACQVYWGLSAQETARLTGEIRRDLPPDGEISSFEIWRRRIQGRLPVRETA